MRLGDLADSGMTLSDMAAAIEITGIAADSRRIEPGYLFAALPGSAADGAAFARAATDRGAAVVLAADGAVVDVPPGIPVVRAPEPRAALAALAARFYPLQPERLVAVTGTAGKTSVADFTRQIFESAGLRAASVGTLGVVTAAGTEKGALTTPDTVALHALLDRLAREGTQAAAVEASSHGLAQHRLHGLRLVSAAFTNLGRDHLDYHRDEDDYFAAKLRLFTEILPSDGTAIVCMDDPRAPAVVATARQRGQRVLSVGSAGDDLRLIGIVADGFTQRVSVEAFGREVHVALPLAGAFQVANALVAAGLAVAAGVETEAALAALDRLQGAPGRIECVGRKANGALAFIDYAHKPDAVRNVLAALRPMTPGRLVIVIGAGGDRDRGKRVLMGQEAAKGADAVIVTDDNPRSENPAAIRAEVLAGAPGAREIGDRAEAIREGVAMLGPGDVLCVAGKGHETGQIVGGVTYPFSDRDEVSGALAEAMAS